MSECWDPRVAMPPKSTKHYIMCSSKESKEYPYLVCCGKYFKGWDLVKEHLDYHWDNPEVDNG